MKDLIIRNGMYLTKLVSDAALGTWFSVQCIVFAGQLFFMTSDKTLGTICKLSSPMLGLCSVGFGSLSFSILPRIYFM